MRWQKEARSVAWWIPVALCGLSFSIAPASAHDDPQDAIERISRQIQEEPDRAALYLKRGELYRFTSRWELAEADFNRVARLEPDHPSVDFHRGRLRLDSGRLVSARQAVDRFLGGNGDHVEGLVVRARILRKLGRPLDAAEDYGRALSRMADPTPVLLVERARALEEGGRDHLDTAIATLDEGIARLGPLFVLESLAIDLEVRRGSYDDALARIDRVTGRMTRKERWLLRRGEVLERTGRFEEARAAYTEALGALETLPGRVRRAPASRELETKLRSLLQR